MVLKLRVTQYASELGSDAPGIDWILGSWQLSTMQEIMTLQIDNGLSKYIL